MAVVTLPAAASVTVTALDVASGEARYTWEASSASALDPDSLVALLPAPQGSGGGPVATVLDKAGETLLTVTLRASSEDLAGATLTLSVAPLSSLVLPSEASSSTPPALHALGVPGAAWLSVGGSRLLLSFASASAQSPLVVARASGTAALGEGLVVDDPAVGASPMFVAAYAEVEKGESSQDGAHQVLTVKVQQVPGPGVVLSGADKGLWRKEESFAIPVHRGNALSGLWLNAYARQPAKGKKEAGSGAEGAGGVGFRFLCTAVDDSLSLLQQVHCCCAL